MRRASKRYSGVMTLLFEKPIQPTHEADETASIPYDSPLNVVHSHGSDEGSVQQHDLTVLVTKLNDRIDGLEKDLQQTKKTYSTALAKRKAKIVLSDDEEIAKDSSQQGRKISQIDEDLTISLLQDEGISWIPQEEEVHEKLSDETEVLIQEETPTDIIEEHGSGKKGEMEISIANIQVSTASPPKVSTALPHVYIRRSAKDKGKAIMKEPATLKKVKKRTQVQLSMDKELARKMEEEERIRFNAKQEARALQQQEEERLGNCKDNLIKYMRPVSIAQARRNMITYLKNQGGYKESYFKKMSYNDIRPIFERVWDHVNTFIPIGSKVEKDSSKPSEKETSKIVEEEKDGKWIRFKLTSLTDTWMLWGDLKILVVHEQDDVLLKNLCSGINPVRSCMKLVEFTLMVDVIKTQDCKTKKLVERILSKRRIEDLIQKNLRFERNHTFREDCWDSDILQVNTADTRLILLVAAEVYKKEQWLHILDVHQLVTPKVRSSFISRFARNIDKSCCLKPEVQSELEVWLSLKFRLSLMDPLMRKLQPLIVFKVLDKFWIYFGLLPRNQARIKLRIGLSEQTLLTALGHAIFYTKKHPSPPTNTYSPFEKDAKIVKQVYSIILVYDKIVLTLLLSGVWDLPSTCCFSPGVPVGPMLTKPTKGVYEYKYDGERAQVHYFEDGTV
ncbi:DNA ligase 1 [Tanacetum coccineum]